MYIQRIIITFCNFLCHYPLRKKKWTIWKNAMKLIYTYEYCISGFPGAKKVKKNEHNVLPFSVPLSLNKRKCEVRGKMQWSFTYEYKPYSIASYVLHIHFRIKLSIIVLQFSVPLFIREKNRVLGKMHWS